MTYVYSFKKDKVNLKKTIDKLINYSEFINNEEILSTIDTYHTFLINEQPFGKYTENELKYTIYNYLSIAKNYPTSNLNKSNSYYFNLLTSMFKNKSYNELKFILNKIKPKNDNEQAKVNYFYLKYYNENDKNTNEIKKLIENCKLLKDNEWKNKCINFNADGV